MELLFVFAPGILSTSLLEKIRDQHFSAFSFLKHTVLFDLFINVCTIVFYYYIYRGEMGILEGFYTNSFLIQYAFLNIISSILLAVVYHFISLHSSITIETEAKKTEEKFHETTES